MKPFLLPLATALLAGLLFVACEGPMGPQGPAGLDGNANVLTDFIEINPEDWITDNDNKLLWADINAPLISKSIALDGGVFLYFASLNFSNEWQILPYSYHLNDTSLITETYWYGYNDEKKQGYVVLEIQGFDAVPPIPDKKYTYKIVAMEGDFVGEK